MQRKIRVLVGKPGLDGHDRGAKVVAAALRDAGMEIIYTGLHQSCDQIVEAAMQEDVDVVALSILSGAHMTLFPDVLELMKERGIEDKLLTGGGIIPPEDMESLAQMGIGRLFGPGSSTQDIAVYIRSWFIARYGADSLPPPPPPPVSRTPSLAFTPADLAHPAAAKRPASKPTSARRGMKPANAKRATKRTSAQRATKVAKSKGAAKKTGAKRATKLAKPTGVKKKAGLKRAAKPKRASKTASHKRAAATRARPASRPRARAGRSVGARRR